MIAIRSLVFNVLFFALTVLWLLLLLPTLLLPRRALVDGVRAYMHVLSALERGVLGLDTRVLGRENLPPPPYILAAKHQSTWETMALYRLIDDPAVVLKRELMRLPLWGWYAARARMIPVDRRGRARSLTAMVEAARAAAAERRPILIFPQGTRVAPGVWRPYRSGVGVLYEALDLPVVPMALNSGMFWGRRSFLKRPGTITVEFLPPIPPGLGRAGMLARLEPALESASDRLVVAVGGPPTPRPPASTAAAEAAALPGG